MGRYLFLFYLIILSSCNQQTNFEGVALAVDGDSLLMNNVTEVRLWGIDAPEYNQNCQLNDKNIRCGLDAKRYLQSLLDGQKVICIQKDIDRYNRIVAICINEKNIEINKAMVKAGWAIDYTRYSGAKYRMTEYRAKQQGIGLWQYIFDFPSIWRKNNRDKLGSIS